MPQPQIAHVCFLDRIYCVYLHVAECLSYLCLFVSITCNAGRLYVIILTEPYDPPVHFTFLLSRELRTCFWGGIYHYGRPLQHIESEETIIICGCFFILSFFLSPHFLRRRKPDIPETFPHDVTQSPTEPLLYRFLRSAPKTNGGLKQNYYHFSRQVAYIQRRNSIIRTYIRNLKHWRKAVTIRLYQRQIWWGWLKNDGNPRVSLSTPSIAPVPYLWNG